MGIGLRNKLFRFNEELRYGIHNAVSRPNKRLQAIYLEPSDMCEPDKLMLFSLIRGLCPERVLEIGVRWGGGARIISSALEENNLGRAVGIDPVPMAFRATRKDLFNRYDLIAGFSPQAIPQAISYLGGPSDFVLIDAMHTHDHVLADLRGVISHLSDDAHVLLHDAYHVGINAAIDTVLQERNDMIDCGILTRHAQFGNAPVAYQGLRLLRKNQNAQQLIAKAFKRVGRTADFSPAIYNWDYHWNRIKSGTIDTATSQSQQRMKAD